MNEASLPKAGCAMLRAERTMAGSDGGSMDLAEAWRALPLGVPDRHAEALTLAATRALRAGRAGEAFELIDRRCRLAERPRAVDLAVRALAAHLCGWPSAAERDIALAESADPLDPMVAMTRLRLGKDAEAANRVARNVAVAGGNASTGLLGALAGRLAAAAEAAPCLVGLDVLDAHLSGFALWPAGRTVELAIDGAGNSLALSLASDPALGRAMEGVAACHVSARLGFEARRYRLRDESGAVLAEGRLWPRRSRSPASGGRAPQNAPPRAPLTIVVPVYRGVAETRECLEALDREVMRYRSDTRIVAVDDASPDEAMRALLAAFAARGAIELRRNAANLGFAGAVNRGLEGAERRDVLILNADAVLPAGALERLASAVYSAPSIGTATPFSNNGEYTSLPRHARASAVPAPDDARRLNAAAQTIGAGRVVDLPTGTGFCLYVRHDCLAAVGGMPGLYGRGYFEDMEFCLQARRAGFRNVCATGVFVVHHGSLSFGPEKRALATRNLSLVRRRFPGIEAECAAYAKADPLRDIREAIVAEAGIEPLEEEVRAADTELVADGARPPSLGVVMPLPSPDADAFVRRLSTHLRQLAPQTRIVVLGQTVDDLALMGRGNVFVTGPVPAQDRRAAALRHGVAAVASPASGAEFTQSALAIGLPVLHPFLPATEASGAIAADDPVHADDPAFATADQFARRFAPQAP